MLLIEFFQVKHLMKCVINFLIVLIRLGPAGLFQTDSKFFPTSVFSQKILQTADRLRLKSVFLMELFQVGIEYRLIICVSLLMIAHRAGRHKIQQ